MAGADRVQLRVGTSSDATTAGDTLLADTNGAELAITDDRTAGVGNVRGWLADGNSHASQVGSQPRGIWATPGDLAADIAAAVTGLLDFKGATNCSANPNYPAASKGDTYVVSVAGKIGGASGKSVDVGDMYLATADNAGGTEASVGTSWSVLEHNLVGAVLAANNLSDLASASTARANLGLAIGTDVQAYDADLTTIAGLTATTDNIIQSVAGAWASRTPAQVKSALAIAESDVASLVTDLAAKAPLASPAFTGIVTLPTGLTGPLRADSGVVAANYAALLAATQTTSNNNGEVTHWTPANIAAAALVANRTLFRFRAFGNFDNIATSGTFTARLKVNGSTIATVAIAASQTGAATLTPWMLDMDIPVEATGVGGTVSAMGMTTSTAAGGGRNPLPFATLASLIALTTGLQFTFTVQMGTANAGNVFRTFRANIVQVA